MTEEENYYQAKYSQATFAGTFNELVVLLALMRIQHSTLISQVQGTKVKSYNNYPKKASLRFFQRVFGFYLLTFFSKKGSSENSLTSTPLPVITLFITPFHQRRYPTPSKSTKNKKENKNSLSKQSSPIFHPPTYENTNSGPPNLFFPHMKMSTLQISSTACK